MIELGTTGNKLTIRALDPYDKEAVRSLKNKIPIYKFDKTLGQDKFQYFELPQDSLGEVLSHWNESKISAVGKAPSLIGKYRLATIALDALPPAPDDNQYSIQPYDYQEKYIRFNLSKDKLLLCLACGMGKSLSSLYRARLLGFTKLIIVCPKTVLFQWQSEINRGLGLESLIYRGSVSQRKKLKDKISQYPVILTNFELCKEIATYKADQLIIDEAHLVSHTETQRYKAVAKLINHNKEAGLQLCTGTPINNKPSDLWALVNLISPEIAGDKRKWRERYEKVLKTKVIYKNIGGMQRRFEVPIVTVTQNLDELHDKLKPIMYRVRREDITVFEDHVGFTTVELSQPQKDMYNRVGNDILLELQNKTLLLSNVLTRMLRLLQVSEGMFHFGGKESSKLEYIQDVIDNNDEKLIVWSRFKALPELLYSKYPTQTVLYIGDQTDGYKQLAKWAFQGVRDKFELDQYNQLIRTNRDFPFGPGEAKVWTGTISQLGSLGMNLDACSRQIFPSFDWLSTVNFQAADRIRRVSQKADKVYTEFLVSERTLERPALEKIFHNHKSICHALDGRTSEGYNQANLMIDLLKESIK